MHGTVVLVVGHHAGSIQAVLGELAVAHAELANEAIGFDVLLVDAGADPLTTTLAAAAVADTGLVTTVTRTDGHTAWATQRDGFDHALQNGSPDFVVTLDAAGHHDARQLPDLLRVFRSRGGGLVIGSRWVRGGSAPGTPLARRLLSRFASWLTARVTGLRHVHDITTSFRVIHPAAAELVSALPATTTEYGFYCEFCAAAQAYGFEVDEVPIAFRPRFSPVAPIRPGDLAGFAADLRRIRSRVRSIRREVARDQAAWAVRSGRFRTQEPIAGSEFGAVAELTELSGAGHFLDWIADLLVPPGGAEGRAILEVGSGLGAMAERLARRDPADDVLAIEPAANVWEALALRAERLPNLRARHMTSRDLAAELATATFDVVLYVNVLEHIEHDADELATAFRLVAPRGTLALFVPAMPSLYGSLDYKSGHYRRYAAADLRQLAERAGFVDVDLRHVDVLGVVPYWLLYRVLGVGRLSRVSSQAYDRVVVPASRLIARCWPRPPFGKNLVLTARRPAA